MTEPDPTSSFAFSLPPSYRERFGEDSIVAHARIVASRGEKAATIGRFEHADPGAAVCVVADDRPGLLSLISAALVMSGLEVVDAEAYCREASGGKLEAIDLFWLRAQSEGEEVTDDAIGRAEATLIGLIEGKLDAEAARGRRREPRGLEETVVRFLEGQDGALAILEVETGDRSGLLHAVTRALFQQRVQIVRSEVRTVDNRVFDRFHVVEFDGAPISESRRLDVQVAVMTAVEQEQTPSAPDASSN